MFSQTDLCLQVTGEFYICMLILSQFTSYSRLIFSQTDLCLQATGEFYTRQHTQHGEVMFVPVQGNSFASMHEQSTLHKKTSKTEFVRWWAVLTAPQKGS